MRSSMTRLRKMLRVVLGVGLLVVVAGFGITGTAQADSFVAISGNISPYVARGQASRVAAPASLPIVHVVVALKARNAAQFQARVDGISNPASAFYGKEVSDAEYARDFAPSLAYYNSVADYVRANGLHILSRDNTRLILDAEGSFAAVSGAFHTTLQYYRLANGRTSYSNATLPQLPASLASGVQSIVGLDDLFRFQAPQPQTTAVTQTQNAVPNATCTPVTFNGHNNAEDVETSYNLDSLYAAKITGKKQTVATTLWDRPHKGFLAQFSKDFCLPKLSERVINVGKKPTPDAGVEVEADLDVQSIHAAAPGAKIIAYVAHSASDADLLTTLTKAAKNKSLTAISNSWGECEVDATSTTLDAYHTVFLLAGSKKIAVLFSSGDSGQFQCENENNPAVTAGQNGDANWPATDPNVIAIGGTTLVAGGTPPRWTTETGWSCPPPPAPQADCYQSGVFGSSGGGKSAHFAKPDYQTSAVSGTQRATPDISSNADGNTTMAVLTVGSQGKGYYGIGGTSASSPWLAGVLALVSQKNKQKVGFANPFFYAHASDTTWLFDVTVGYNGANAGAGYDLVTGLGSIKDGAALATAFGAP